MSRFGEYIAAAGVSAGVVLGASWVSVAIERGIAEDTRECLDEFEGREEKICIETAEAAVSDDTREVLEIAIAAGTLLGAGAVYGAVTARKT